MMGVGQYERPLNTFIALSSLVLCMIILLSNPWSADFISVTESLTDDNSKLQETSIKASQVAFRPVPFGRPSVLDRAFPNDQSLKNDLRFAKRTLTFDAAKCKGARLLEAMSGPGQPSSFTDFQSLDKDGWHVYYDANVQESVNDMRNPFATLGLSSVKRPGTQIAKAIQEGEFTFNGQVIKEATGGEYINLFSVEDRYIVAQSNFSPETMSDTPSIKPDLSRWSDVAWLIWEKMSTEQGADPGDLQYIFRSSIINGDTKAIINIVAGLREGELFNMPWPGKSFATTTDDGQALLGTANGNGVAWLVINHMNAFAGKRVQKVGIFSSPGPEDSLSYSMYFQIG